ncbi:N-acetylmuramoyl-L-alanine amidase [Trichloromonas sp.]|uniref:N-acetylmuramoyl-L-alanine amidase n=1 Tax=Trichloromonas sp. TaxID=3069249 RepID=UPI003D819F21
MLRLFVLFLLLSAWVTPACATVELALGNQAPAAISEVYYRDGISFLAIDDVLPALGLSGRWDSVAHVYTISTPYGIASISPGSQYLRMGGRFVPLKNSPRFIDGRLRVDETFVSEQFPALLGLSVYYRNLNPQAAPPAGDESSLDRFFSFLLQKKEATNGPALRGVVIDPGHGGQEPGSLGLGGVKEKTVALDVARALEKQLKMQLGIPVYLTRDTDYALSSEQRLEPATRSDVDVLLQLHAQASPHAETSGMFLFVRPQEEFEGGAVPAEQGGSMHLAKSLQKALLKQGLPVARIVPAPLLPLGRGNLPTVLVEMGYLTNAADVALLTQPEARNRLVLALYDGLKTFADEQKENLQ